MTRSLLLALLVALPGAAHAINLGLDLDAAWVTNTQQSDKTGFGGSVRLGHDVSLVGPTLQLEVGAGLHGFADDHPGGFANLYQVFGGARVGLGEFFRPGVYAHVGYGWTQGRGDGAYVEGGGVADLAFPVGSVGIHVAYQAFFVSSFYEVLPHEPGSDVVASAQVFPQIFLLGVHAALSF